MTIEEAIASAESTRSTVEAQEFRGCKYAKLTTQKAKTLCKWVIEMGREIATLRAALKPVLEHDTTQYGCARAQPSIVVAVREAKRIAKEGGVM